MLSCRGVEVVSGPLISIPSRGTALTCPGEIDSMTNEKVSIQLALGRYPGCRVRVAIGFSFW